MKTLKDIWHSSKGALGSAFLDMLNKQGTKLILKKVLKTSGGFRAWLVSFIVEEVVEEIDENIVEPIFRKIGYSLEVQHGKKVYKRVINASDNDDWINSVNDV